MISEVAAIIRKRALAEWIEKFRRVDACVEPVLSLQEAIESPQVKHRELAAEIDHATEGKIRQLNLPFKLSATAEAMRLAAPLLGEHTRPILESLGYAADEIQHLVAAGIVSLEEVE